MVTRKHLERFICGLVTITLTNKSWHGKVKVRRWDGKAKSFNIIDTSITVGFYILTEYGGNNKLDTIRKNPKFIVVNMIGFRTIVDNGSSLLIESLKGGERQRVSIEFHTPTPDGE